MRLGHLRAAAEAPQLPFDVVGQLVNGLDGYGALGAGVEDAAANFGAGELLAPSVLLDTNEGGGLDVLQGGEAEATEGALPPAANAIGGVPGVDDPGIWVFAVGAAHVCFFALRPQFVVVTVYRNPKMLGLSRGLWRGFRESATVVRGRGCTWLHADSGGHAASMLFEGLTMSREVTAQRRRPWGKRNRPGGQARGGWRRRRAREAGRI